MIELIMRSGMGNQMFQYAFARRLQLQYPDEEILINDEFMKRHDFRSYSLSHCVLNDKVRLLDTQEAKRDLTRFYLRIPMAFGKDLITWKLFNRQAIGREKFYKREKRGLYYAHKPYEYYPIHGTRVKDKYIFGFFQDANLVDGMEDILRKEFEIKTAQSPENAELLERINGCNSVCFHVRRGDYLDQRWKALQVCDYDYYKRAVEEAKQFITNPVFFVFSTGSEDLNWVRDNYRFDADMVYVDLDNPDYEEIRLMQSCSHFIISNSTFSWWAAFLGRSQNKMVWAPSLWNKEDPNTSVICPAEWRRIVIQ